VIDAASIAAAAAAALAAGAVNAIAGGGSLITFPTLVALGLPQVTANITNTVALCPGYFGAAFAQRHELAGQGRRAALLLPVGALAGMAGALLLLATGERAFAVAVPFLLLVAALLLGAQDRVRRRLLARTSPRAEAWAALPIAFAAIYGGYFGAGMGVMIVAALGIVLADGLRRVNALKQCISLVVNLTAAGVFVGSGRVDWPIAGAMAVGALAGGLIGGKLLSRLPTRPLRWLIVTLSVALAVVYFVRLC
jgi:uncharacterized protein